MKEKITKTIEWLFLALLIIQSGFIIYFNLSYIRCSLDHDLANTFYHYMEVIKNGTMQLPDWNHTTTLELDGSFLFAVPLYFLTKNIFLSVGISNIILMALYILVISRIMHHAGVSKLFTYFTLCLVLTPYSFGMLEYFNMMFYGGACYSIKTLVPLIFLLLLQLLTKENYKTTVEKAELIASIALYTGLLFVTAFSTGIYTMLCGLFPIIICMIIDVWNKGSLKGIYNLKHIVAIVGTFVVFLIGYILHNRFYPSVSRTNMSLTKIENYAINFRACVAGIFQVFGATTSADIEALSFWGIVYCLKMGLVVLFLIAFIYNIPNIFSKSEKLDVKKHLAFLFLFNFIILVIADCRYSTNTHIEYRYYLIGAVPLILLLGIQLSEWKNHWNDLQSNTLYAGIFVALSLVVIGNNKGIITNWDRTTYAVELCDYFNTLDIDSVFFVNDPDTSIICKGIDQNHKYGAYMSESQSLYLSICSYNQSTQGSFYGDKNIIAVITGNNLTDLIPSEIATQYTYIDTVRWYDLYIAEQVLFP